VALARPRAAAIALPPAPRAIEGETAALLRRVAPSAWALMDSSRKPNERPGVMDYLGLAFFSVLTLGVLPIAFFSIAAARRRQLRRFLRDGRPAEAVVLAIRAEQTAFAEKIALVSYEFEADGARHRGADRVLQVIANRWQPGDRVQVLFVPEAEYDSVIVSTS
jgi:hypothetical protein